MQLIKVELPQKKQLTEVMVEQDNIYTYLLLDP